MSPNLPAGISQEELDALINNPGMTVSNGGVAESPTTHTAQSSTSIDVRSTKGVRPNIGGNNNHDVSGQRISRPSSTFAARLAAGDEELKAAAQAQREAERIAKENADPISVNARLSFLERQNKKLMSELNKLKKSNE